MMKKLWIIPFMFLILLVPVFAVGEVVIASSADFSPPKPVFPLRGNCIHLLGDSMVLHSDNSIEVFLSLANDCPDAYSGLIELQPRKSAYALVAFAMPQDVCDSSHPENVHSMVYIDGNSRLVVSLRTPPLSKGSYTPRLLSANGCAVGSNAVPSWEEQEPYFYGVNSRATVKIGDVVIPGNIACTEDWQCAPKVCKNPGVPYLSECVDSPLPSPSPTIPIKDFPLMSVVIVALLIGAVVAIWRF